MRVGSFIYSNLANLVTFLGILLCLAMAGVVIFNGGGTAMIFFLSVAICLTDWIDGQIARRLKIVSNFGAALDRLRDKAWFAILAAFFLMDGQTGLAIKIPLALLAAVETALLALWFAGVAKGMNVSANKYGKAKMILISAGILLCLTAKFWSSAVYESHICRAVFGMMFLAGFLLSMGSLKLHWTQYKLQLPCRIPKKQPVVT